jgi:glutathione S-transferase
MAKTASHTPTTSKSGRRQTAASGGAGSSRRRASAKSRFTLHGIWLSGPTYKVGLMLRLSGAPFSYVHVNLREGEHKKPDYLAKNRFGQVPCLADGKLHLCQSAAILEYLADALGRFNGRSGEERARIREWLFWDFDRLAPGVYRARAIKRGFQQTAPEVLAMHETAAKAGLSVLDAALAAPRFLAGARPTIADIDCYGVVHYAPEAGIDLSAYPNVGAWMRRVEKLKGFGAPADVLPQESRG